MTKPDDLLHVNEPGNIWLTDGESDVAWFLLDGALRDGEIKLLEVSVCPQNYPGFEVHEIFISPAKLAEHINKKCEGWWVRKLNLVPVGSVKVNDNNEIEVDDE